MQLPAEAAEEQDNGQKQQQQQQIETFTFPDMDDAKFAALGRDNPKLLMAVLEAAKADKAAWQAFQVGWQAATFGCRAARHSTTATTTCSHRADS